MEVNAGSDNAGVPPNLFLAENTTLSFPENRKRLVKKILSCIKEGRTSLQIYICHNNDEEIICEGRSMAKFLNILRQKSQEQVNVQLCTDGFGISDGLRRKFARDKLQIHKENHAFPLEKPKKTEIFVVGDAEWVVLGRLSWKLEGLEEMPARLMTLQTTEQHFLTYFRETFNKYWRQSE